MGEDKGGRKGICFGMLTTYVPRGVGHALNMHPTRHMKRCCGKLQCRWIASWHSLSLSRWPCCQNVGNYCFPHFPLHWCIMQNIHFFHCSFLQNMFCWSLFSGQESNNIWCDFLETALSNQRKKTTELQWLHCKRYWACNRGHANNYIGQRYLAWHCVSRMHLASTCSIMWKVFDCDLFHVFVLQGLHMKTKRNIILKIDSKPQMKLYTGWKTCLTQMDMIRNEMYM